MTERPAGKIQTVLGPIEPGELGFTLTHEHILVDLSVRFKLPDESMTARIMANKKVSLEMLGWLRFHLFENIDNLMLDDEAVLTQEVALFKKAGGKAIAGMTNWGLGRDPHALVRISRATGLHIIMGSGYYTMDSGCARVLAEKSENEIYGDTVALHLSPQEH
jgi:phosphotriesterase-related protein